MAGYLECREIKWLSYIEIYSTPSTKADNTQFQLSV